MNQKEIIELIDNKFGIVKSDIYDEYQLSVVVKKENIFAALALMQLNDFKELSILTAVDWLDRNVFEVVYILFSYTHNQQLILKTEIDRNNPEIVSVMKLWEVAETYERDVHEFFGIKFLGNPSLKPFFLHNWLDMPPLRKDFNTQQYSDKVFGKTKEERKK